MFDTSLAEAYYNRGAAWFYKKEYDLSWEDVNRSRAAGGTPDPLFIAALEKASGRRNPGRSAGDRRR